MQPIAVYYEHPDWFRPLFAELDRRDVPYVRLDAASHQYDPHERSVPYGLVFNRASQSAFTRGHRQTAFYTLHWLRHLERIGVSVVNGAAVYEVDVSKARQLGAFDTLGLAYPATRIANSGLAVLEAARGLRYPVLVKPNIGGAGAGIERFEDASSLEAAVQGNTLDFGVDGAVLVQEMAPLRDGHVTRVEVLGGRYLYAINVFPAPDSLFNLCPADVCQTTDGRALSRSACALDAPKTGLRVERTDPPAAIIDEVERIAHEISLDVGGIEYLIDDRDGRRYYYDINALSNFVADARNVIGFDPHERLVDYLLARTDPRASVRPAASASLRAAEVSRPSSDDRATASVGSR